LSTDRRETGRAVRREVLGEAHVARSETNATEFDAPFQAFVTEGAWGSVWSRPELTRRERSMITLAILAALGREDEFRLHLRATANTGASAEDVREALLHVAVYAGVPAANTAFRIAKEILAEREAEG
jgi:4-carboxymuconolactone decarboxylase